MSLTQKFGIIIYVITIIFCVVSMSAFYFRVQKTSKLWSLLACQALIVIWLILALFEVLIRGTPLFPHVVRYTLITLYFLGPCWLLFSLEYLDMINASNRFWRWLIFLPAIISSIPSLLDRFLYLAIVQMSDAGVSEWGIVFNINVYLMYGCVIVSTILIMLQSFQERRMIGQKLLLVGSVSLTVIVSVLYSSKVIPEHGFDITPITFVVFITVVSVLVFKHRMIDILPYASNEVYMNLSDPVIILNNQGKLADMNNAAVLLFSLQRNTREKIDWEDFLSRADPKNANKEQMDRIRESMKTDTEKPVEETLLLFGDHTQNFQYDCKIIPLRSSFGRLIGKIITFHDLTEIRQMTLKNERTRLAGDLHDSIGDDLNTILVSLDYIQNRFRLEPEVAKRVEVSYEKGVQALLDLRRIVDGLKPVDIERNGLIWALEALFHRRQLQGVYIRFSYDVKDHERHNQQSYGETIYHICQEAIHNAVNHGKATEIEVILAIKNDQARLYISDNGIGCGKIIEGKGLVNMRYRISLLGGNIEYGSPSDGGFSLKVSIPIFEEIGCKPERDLDDGGQAT